VARALGYNEDQANALRDSVDRHTMTAGADVPELVTTMATQMLNRPDTSASTRPAWCCVTDR